MSTTITYDDFMFTGSEGFPTPYISRNQTMLNYGNRFGQLSEFTLNGQITGNNFSDLINKQNILLSGFANSFKSLDITEDGESIAGFPAKNCRVENISFDGNKYVSIIDYSISLNSFDQGIFSGYFGITEPIDQISFQESNDGSISVSHETSARGMSANGKSSIENAKDFVHLNSGWKNSIDPFFIEYSKGVSLYNSDFTSTNGWIQNLGSIVAPRTIGGKDNCLKYTANTDNSDSHYIYKENHFSIGTKYRINGEIYIGDDAGQNINSIAIHDIADNTQTPIFAGGTKGSWVSFETEFTASGTNLYFWARESSSDYEFQGDSSNHDWFAIKNISLQEVVDFSPILISQNETINRMEGTYGLSETYSISKTGNNNLMSGHQVTISSGIGEEFVSVGVSAKYKGNFGENIDEVRNKITNLNSISYYEIATGLSDITTLSSGAKNFTINEDSGAAIIEVSCNYSNDKLFDTGNCYLDYNVSINTNELNSRTSLSIDAEIKTIGNKKDRFNTSQEFLENTIYSESGSSNHEAKYAGYLYNRANEEYTKLSKPYSLRSYPTSCKINKDRDNGIISLSASFDDSYQYSDNVKSSSWSINVVPPLRKYIATSDVVTYPKHIFWNTDVMNRSNIQVAANASSFDSINKSYGLTTLESFMTNVYNIYVSPNSDIIEDSSQLKFNEKTLNYNKTKSWSFHNSTEWITLPAPPKP